eukprot:scaffold1627_cov44-Cylindrotheca_fusiformis.AAC.1
MVLRRKTAELHNKNKAKEAIQQRRQRSENSSISESDTASKNSVPDKRRREEIFSWLELEIDTARELTATGNKIAEHEILVGKKFTKTPTPSAATIRFQSRQIN